MIFLPKQLVILSNQPNLGTSHIPWTTPSLAYIDEHDLWAMEYGFLAAAKGLEGKNSRVGNWQPMR